MSRGSIGLGPELNDYIVKAHGAEHPVLRKLRLRTARMPMAEMQIAPEQGAFLTLMTRLIGARRAIEIGTFTGYSALCIARGLPAETQREIERNLRYQQAAAEAGDVAGFYVLDVEFHKLIVDGLALRHAREILDGLRSHLERVRRIALSPPGRLPSAHAEHIRIFEAILSGKGADAAVAMRAHLDETTATFERIAVQNPENFIG